MAAAATPDLREDLSPSPSHSSHSSESPVPEQSAVSHRDPANGLVWRPAPSLREEGSGLARINSLSHWNVNN